MSVVFRANASGVSRPNVQRSVRFSDRKVVRYPRVIPGAVLCRCGRKPGVVLVDGGSGFEVPVCAVCMFGLEEMAAPTTG